MSKDYRKMTVSQERVQLENDFLATSRPIVMEADVTVTPFVDGNADAADPGDFTVTFD